MGFHVSYQLDLFGQIRRGIEAAKADTETAQAAYDVTRVTVAAETARAYADVCGAGLELAAARHILDLQRQSSDLTARLVKAGRGVSTDVTDSEAQVALSSASIPTLEAQQKLALYPLATLTGRPPAVPRANRPHESSSGLPDRLLFDGRAALSNADRPVAISGERSAGVDALPYRPAPPREIAPEVPRPVSDIVMNLLAKLPDDRYHSARGLGGDLDRCLASWQALGRVEPWAALVRAAVLVHYALPWV